MKAAHAALSDSKHPTIEAKMAGEWSDDNKFMKEIHPAHAIWGHDESTKMAKAALTHTRVNLVTAIMQHKEGERALTTDKVETDKLPPALQHNPGTDWVAHARDAAHSFGKVVGEATVQCFNWARHALKATARR